MRRRGIASAAALLASVALLGTWPRANVERPRVPGHCAIPRVAPHATAVEPGLRGLPGAAPAAAPAAAARPRRRHVTFFRAPSRGGDLGAIARALLEEHREELGLDDVPGTLEVVREFDSLSGRHLRLAQTVAGVPVFGAEVSAHVTRDGRPLLVQAEVEPVEGAATAATVSADEAAAAASAWVTDDERPAPVETKPPRLVILPEGRRGRLAWRVDVRTESESARVFVDAGDGEVVRSDSLRVGGTGSGVVFDPNPVYSLRNGSLKDSQDKDSAALATALRVVQLPRLDGSGYLRGTWADATSTSDPTYSAALNWSSITRSDPAFEQVMAYYHVDGVQARYQELGLTNVNAERQNVDARAFSADQSLYDVFDDVIRLGTGGVDDAEDADIIRHEYGHATQFAQVEDFGLTDEGGAMGEGFGDFLAASFHENDPAFDPLVGGWDAVSYSSARPPYLRRVDTGKRYPDDFRGEQHADGEIWSQFLWDLKALIGSDEALRVVLESHFLLTPGARFTQGANAVLLANEAVRGGADDVAIRDLLDDRGIHHTVPLADPPADDAFEDNDDVDHATALVPGVLPALVSIDEDWYRLDVAPNRRWQARTIETGEHRGLEVELYARSPVSSVNERVAWSATSGAVESVDASAAAAGATYFVRIHHAAPGARAIAYDLAVLDTDLIALVPGRATPVSLTAHAPAVFRVDVPASKAGRKLRVQAQSKRRRGTLPEIRVTSPTGVVAVEFGTGRAQGARASVPLVETGSWVVEVRSREALAGGVRLRARFD